MERLRDGKDLNLRVDLHLTAEEHRPIEGDQKTQRPTIWGVHCVLRLTVQLATTIPRDIWISRVLPNVGHGVVHLVEFPAVPVESCASLEHAFKALQQAQERHKIGLYDDAVGKCRIALEKFFEREDKTGSDGKTREIPVLKKTWETKLGKATYDWLNAALGSIKGAANPTAHSPNVHYSQFDSQMVLAITTAVIAYVARTIGTEAEK